MHEVKSTIETRMYEIKTSEFTRILEEHGYTQPQIIDILSKYAAFRFSLVEYAGKHPGWSNHYITCNQPHSTARMSGFNDNTECLFSLQIIESSNTELDESNIKLKFVIDTKSLAKYEEFTEYTKPFDDGSSNEYGYIYTLKLYPYYLKEDQNK